jgi:hypothetical protein
MAFGMKRPALLLAALAIAGIVSGCTNNASGQAVPPATGSPGTSNSDGPTSTSSGQGGGGNLDAVDPCSLLTAAEASQFQAGSGVPKQTSGARTCDWTIPDGRGTFGIDLRNSQGLKDIVEGGGTLTDQPVGSHQGKILKEADGPGACSVIIGVTDSSRVDVSSVANTDTAKACEYVTKVAALIEPRLPKGE